MNIRYSGFPVGLMMFVVKQINVQSEVSNVVWCADMKGVVANMEKEITGMKKEIAGIEKVFDDKMLMLMNVGICMVHLL